MSDYTVIGAVDETLTALLWSSMEHDSQITSILATQAQISLEPPFKLVREIDPDQNTLSLFLYRVVENGDMKNRPFEPANGNLLRPPPLALNLFYLITPLTNSAVNDRKLLGKTMQILYDHAIIKGSELQA